VSSPYGQVLACRPDGYGWEMLAGDADGVHPFAPRLAGAGLEYEWDPSGRPTALFTDTATGVLLEADFTTRTVRTIQTEPVRHACYTHDGHAALVGAELVLHRWRHGGDDRPEVIARLPVRGGEASALGTAWDGSVVYLCGAGRTSFLRLAPDGVRPLGSFPGGEWFAGWLLDDAMVFQTKGDGPASRAFQVTGVESAAGGAHVTEIDLSAQPALEYEELGAYPGRTTWRV
jgi:hypothetical protein